MTIFKNTSLIKVCNSLHASGMKIVTVQNAVRNCMLIIDSCDYITRR